MNDPRSLEEEYILGTNRDELARLAVQHDTWRDHAVALWNLAGLSTGHHVLDLGCGPGHATLDLAARVGSQGRVVGRDQSARFLAHLQSEMDRRSLSHVSTSLGDVETADASIGTFNFIYARWLFCWLEHPEKALAACRTYLKPGGKILLQEYIDWATLALVPPSVRFKRAVKAAMDSWDLGIGRINIARFMPDLCPAVGLRVARIHPVARLGGVGSPVWTWLGGFVHSYVPRLVDQGLITPDEVDAMRSAWREREVEGHGYCFAPTMCDLILQRTEDGS